MGGLFAWALDEGGPGSLANPNDLDPSDASMSGASTEGGSDGTGDLYVDDSVLHSDSNTATGIAPLNIIVAPTTLASMTTFSIEPLVTPIEVAWTTTKTVTISGVPTVTTTIARTVQTTTFSMPTITASVIPWWNWNITDSSITQDWTTLFPSISLDPITFKDSPNPQNITNSTFVPHPVTGDRTFYPPPWPWSTTSLPVKLPTPTITFSQGGPPGPTCTSGCGTKCTSFCDKPCLLNCDDPKDNLNWEDPVDPNPPDHSGCSGPDCEDNKCTGPLCVKKGCTGDDCDPSSGTCLGPQCEEIGCLGDDCGPGGKCEGDNCEEIGCTGSDCNGTGLCIGEDCVSIGCIGPRCDPETGKCLGYDCYKVSCSGPNCDDGVCTGEGCEPGDEDCETEEADMCTEYISSSMVTEASTYSTTTSTDCQTITACHAEATTTTSTITSDGSETTGYRYWYHEVDLAAAATDAAEIDADYSAFFTTPTPTTTSTTSTETTTTSTETSTTTNPHTPGESSTTCGHGQTMCHLFVSNLHGFCDMAKSYLRGDDLYG